jgi:hypothetical protein
MPASPAKPNVAIYSGGDPTQTQGIQVLQEISTGVYTTVILWAAHVDASGNFAMNDDPIVSNGKFVSSALSWAKVVAGLKTTTGTTITRVELSIGGDQTSFANIQALFQKYGNKPTNPLYGNLKVLQSTLSLDAINYDDESTYDPNSSLGLAMMCAGLGMRVSICPFTMQAYWVNLVNAINQSQPGTADAVYLQCYDGGAGNDPASWNKYFSSTGLGIAPGLWATHQEANSSQCTQNTTASQANAQFSAWAKQSSLAGGFMFVGTDMLKCPNGGTPADYASAIADAFGGS